MYQSIGFGDFCDAFRAYDRNENFTYEGKCILFDYLEEYEDSTGESIELDVIALCCEYSEDSIEDIINNYSIDIEEDTTEEEKADIVEEYLSENTILVGKTDIDTFIYAAF